MKHKPSRYPKRRTSTQWASLPVPALVEILKYLSDSEKVACAQVCRHWHIAFGCPILWRTREFGFGGSRFRPLGQKSVLYARRFGKYLRHLIISCHHLTSHTCETMLENLRQFLETLVECGPPVLYALEMEGLEMDFWRYGYLREQVATMLIPFFRSQNKLKEFCMPLAQFALQPGLDVLETIADGNKDKLQTLLIDFFFLSRQAVFENNRFNRIMATFSNLAVIYLNYCCLSEELVRIWAESLGGKLEHLHIKCKENESNVHVIANSAWATLCKACPLLEVDVDICGLGHSSIVIPILAPALPLMSLEIFAGYDNESELGISSVLSHLTAHFHDKLRHLDLEMDNAYDDIDEALMTTVTRCTKITHLKIKARLDVDIIRYICRLLEEGRTSLVHVDIMLCDVTSPDVELDFDRLRQDVGRIAQRDNIDLILRDDHFPEPF